jgi:phospholipid/cholesterol/gamma-HCH transport system permease protein
MASMLFHLGRYILLLNGVFSKPQKFSIYWKEFIRNIAEFTERSVFIVVMVSVFMGAVTAVQTAYQLVSGLVPLEVIAQITRDSSILELAPTIVMLVLAGNIGSQIASEIGTMKVTEQIDALEMMGVNAKSFLILPKIVSGLIVIPCLVIVSIALCNLGGYFAATMSGAVTNQQYLDGLFRDFNAYIIQVGIIKAFVFSFIVTSVSSYIGFYTEGGALEVGSSSTRAVVFSCIIILIADYLIAQILL